MAEGGQRPPTRTETLSPEVDTAPPRSPCVVLKLQKPKNDKKVQWDENTVDNEHMNKKKSKCCCIYEKPRMFGESSSEDEDDDGCSPHCRGHKKRMPHHHHDHNHDHHDHSNHDGDLPGPSSGSS